ncbi:MAG: type II secretion system F family protein [Candidatus Micrarchaeota archaeon]|nr:type II secretion system F family protein [Candidatus Micrarchaeota archaeon]
MFGKKQLKKDFKEIKNEERVSKQISYKLNSEPYIPIQLISVENAKYGRFLLPLARLLLTENKKDEIRRAYLRGDPDHIIVAFILSSLLWAIIFSLIVFVLQIFIIYATPESAANLSIITFLFTFLLFFYVHYIYPGILAKKMAETTDFELLYVLREMWIDATSGVPLYNILVNIAKAGYGPVSKDIDDAVREINAGERDVIALEKVAQKTTSESFKRILWHLSSSMRTGVGLTLALENSINMISAEQIRKIREYGASLNFYLLLYLLFAAVIPSIVITFFAILSAFGIFPITFNLLFALVVLSALLQIILIGLMRAGRPQV